MPLGALGTHLQNAFRAGKPAKVVRSPVRFQTSREGAKDVVRLEENSHLLQPPINNYCVYNEDFTVMVSTP